MSSISEQRFMTKPERTRVGRLLTREVGVLSLRAHNLFQAKRNFL
ncbi:MAG TPA: hypothetical protein VHD63_26645 [Ktedonobacteraceae bacterium]|nr:hypothetical protein [Ktedonobacteraceae bacterium]